MPAIRADSPEDFVYSIRGSVDHAGMEINNDGGLWKQFNGDLDHVQYVAPLGIELPAGTELADDETLKLTARNWFGRGVDDVTFWMETQRRHGSEMPCITGKFEGRDDSVPIARIDNDRISTDEFERYVLSYMSFVPELPRILGKYGVAQAFKDGLAYIIDSPFALNGLRKRSGEKSAESAGVVNGFQVNAYTAEQIEGATRLTTYGAEVSYAFSPRGLEMPYAGRLFKALKVSIIDDQIVATERSSSVSLMNNPFLNGDDLMAYSDGTTMPVDTLPESLTEHLYPDSVPTDEDVAFFKNLVTKPLTEKDVNIIE